MNRSITVDIGANIAGLQAGLSQALSGLSSFASQATRSLGSAFNAQTFATAARTVGDFGRQAQSAGQMLSVGLSAPLALFGKQSIETFGDMDALRRGLATLEKDAGSLTTRLSQLREVAKLPGLGYKEAIQFDVSLRSAGFSADLSKRSMIAFGNALGTIGKGKNELKGVSVQLQQLATKTGGYGADLRIIKEYAPQVGAALMKGFGTIDTEKIAKMGVTGKQVVERIVGELEKLPKATGGAKNTFENFGDTATTALDKVGTAIYKSLHLEGFINGVGSAITALADKFGNLPATTQTLVSAFGLLAIALPPLIAGIGFFTTTVLPALRAGMAATRVAMLAMTGPVGLIIAAVAAAAVLIIMHWDKIKKALVDSGVWTQLKGIVGAALGVITGIFGVFANLFQGDWAAMWEHMKNILKSAWNGIISILGGGILAMGGLLAGAMSMVGLDKMSKAVSDHMDSVEKTIQSRKFDIAAPSFDLFSGFNFGGQNAIDGSDTAGGGKKKKEKKEKDYYFIDYARERVSALQKEIENLKALGNPIPQALYNSLKVFTDLVEDAESAARDLKGVDLGDKLKPINTASSGRLLKATSGPVLPGLSEFQFGAAQKIRDQRIATEGELMKFRHNLTEFPAFMGSLRAAFAESGANLFTDTAEKIRSNVDKMAEVMRQAKMALKESAVDAFGGLAEGLAASTSSLDAGKQILKNTLRDIINVLAAQAITIGKAMILLSLPMIGSGLWSVIGAKQMITGVALVAAGGVAKGLSATAFADGGTVSGPTYSLTGEYQNARTNPEWITPVDKGAGLIAGELMAMGGLGGGGGTITTRVSGTDLLLVLERTTKSQKAYGNG